MPFSPDAFICLNGYQDSKHCLRQSTYAPCVRCFGSKAPDHCIVPRSYTEHRPQDEAAREESRLEATAAGGPRPSYTLDECAASCHPLHGGGGCCDTLGPAWGVLPPMGPCRM